LKKESNSYSLYISYGSYNSNSSYNSYFVQFLRLNQTQIQIPLEVLLTNRKHVGFEQKLVTMATQAVRPARLLGFNRDLSECSQYTENY
jgi:hypothetical protein